MNAREGNADNLVDVVAVIIDATRRHIDRKHQWTMKARIVRVAAKVPAEKALTGLVLNIIYNGPMVPNLSIHPGILFRVSIPLVQAEKALDDVAAEQQPEITLTPDILKAMPEPCARVPLSLLQELRGQEAGTEYSRRALMRFWSEDRRTGKASATDD